MSEVRTLILMRPRAQSEAFAAALEDWVPGRFRIVVAPLIEIVPVPAPLDLAGLQGLVFTSANGVEQFAARSRERGLTAYCVGSMTAAAARRAGFTARSADGDVAGLAALVAAAYRPGRGAFLHVRGRHAAGDLAGLLGAAGVPARAAEIYDQAERPLPPAAREVLGRGAGKVLAFFSARSTRLFVGQARDAEWDLSTVTAVSLSRATDAALEGIEVGVRRIASAPTRDGMLAALAEI